MTPTAETIVATHAEEILRRAENIELRRFALSSTINFAKVSGSNPWDFKTGKPRQDQKTGFYPWCPYAERMATYLDKPTRGMPKPIKPLFVARDHLKTSIAAEAMARVALMNPNKLYGVIADTDDKASLRLRTIGEIYKQDVFQRIFPQILYTNDGKARDYYTNKFIRLKRTRTGGQQTLHALGAGASSAGYHFDGGMWCDDIVNEENYDSPDLMEKLWDKLQQLIQYVCSPGCPVWITGTRYSPYDTYRYVLAKDGPLYRNIVPGSILVGCWEVNGKGDRKPLNFLKFCIKQEDQEKPVRYKGVRFTPIRESLDEKKESTEPKSVWFAQMENNPQDSENQAFTEGDFKHRIPATSDKLEEWLGNQANVMEHILRKTVRGDEPKLDRLPLTWAILGDIAYTRKGRSDYSVLLVVAQDAWDHWYLAAGWRRRTGHRDLRGYFKWAFQMRAKFNVKRRLGIETHAKESTILAAEMVAAEEGVPIPQFHRLKDNSYKNKDRRITSALEGMASGKKIHVCADFPRDIMEKIDLEAQQLLLAGGHDDSIDALANGRQVFPVRKRPKKPMDMAPWRNQLSANIRRFL